MGWFVVIFLSLAGAIISFCAIWRTLTRMGRTADRMLAKMEAIETDLQEARLAVSQLEEE